MLCLSLLLLLPVGWADWNPCCGWLFRLVWCCLFLSQDQPQPECLPNGFTLALAIHEEALSCSLLRTYFLVAFSWCSFALSCGFSRIEKGCIFASAAVVEINVLQVKCFQRNHPLLEQRIPFSDFRFFSSNFCLPQVLGQGPNGYVYMQIMQEYADIMQVTPLMAAVLVGKFFGAPLKGLVQFLFTVCGLLCSFQKFLNKNTQPC